VFRLCWRRPMNAYSLVVRRMARELAMCWLAWRLYRRRARVAHIGVIRVLEREGIALIWWPAVRWARWLARRGRAQVPDEMEQIALQVKGRERFSGCLIRCSRARDCSAD